LTGEAPRLGLGDSRGVPSTGPEHKCGLGELVSKTMASAPGSMARSHWDSRRGVPREGEVNEAWEGMVARPELALASICGPGREGEGGEQGGGPEANDAGTEGLDGGIEGPG
jgi:hypothetical protein